MASGGAGTLEHFHEAVEAGATILLAASIFHFGIIGIPELKAYLRERGVKVCGGEALRACHAVREVYDESGRI